MTRLVFKLFLTSQNAVDVVLGIMAALLAAWALSALWRSWRARGDARELARRQRNIALANELAGFAAYRMPTTLDANWRVR